MSSALPSPPPSRSASPSPDVSVLASRLDDLLVEYLDLLDRYTTLRTRLAENVSSAFLSLARAQRTSTLGPARRYGEECYDQRMKAQRRVVAQMSEAGSSEMSVKSIRPSTIAQTDRGENSRFGKSEDGHDEDSLQPIIQPPADREKREEEKEEDKDNKKHDTLEPAEVAAATITKTDPADKNPISWFGLLVPPALKQTQTHFVTAVEELVPALVNADAEMKVLEAEIWEVRTKLEMLDQY